MKNTKKVVYTTTGAIAGIIIASVFGAYASGTGDITSQKITSGVKTVLHIENNEEKETNKSEVNETIKLASKVSITEEQARNTANITYKGTIKKVSLDDENGVIVYSIEYNDGTDVKVNANTNIVVKIDSTDSEEKDDIENERDGQNGDKDNIEEEK